MDLGEWSEFSACSVSCGPGTKTQTRDCNTGVCCGATLSISDDCEDNEGISSFSILVDNVILGNKMLKIVNFLVGWEDWGNYGECSEVCGHGTMTRTRAPKVAQCVPSEGISEESKACNTCKFSVLYYYFKYWKSQFLKQECREYVPLMCLF